MKNRFHFLPKIVFAKSLLLFLCFAFIVYRSPTYNSLVLFSTVTIIFLVQLFILFSNYKTLIRKIIWPCSYILGLSFLLNLNKEWLFLSWKYQFIFLLFVLFSMVYLRFISRINNWFLFFAFLNSFIFLGYSWIIVWNNLEDEIYFTVAKWFTYYLIFLAIIMTASSRRTSNKAEKKQEKS
jgi:hypothetical protein